MTPKFKPWQKVVIKDFLINSSRLDIGGTVIRYVLNRITREWKVEVVINSIYVLLDESRVVDYDEYHATKKDK